MKKQTLRQKLADAEARAAKADRDRSTAEKTAAALREELETTKNDLRGFIRIHAFPNRRDPCGGTFMIDLCVSRFDLSNMAKPEDYLEHVMTIFRRHLIQILTNPPR